MRVVEASDQNAEDLLDRLIDLHGRRWAAKGEAGVLAHPEVRRFHRMALPRLLASNLLRLFGLEIEGRLVAACYGLAHRRQAYAYLNGFDPAFGLESPGTALIGHAVQDAVARGCMHFHFLRGQESYKYAWGAEDRWNVVRRLWLDQSPARPAETGQLRASRTS